MPRCLAPVVILIASSMAMGQTATQTPLPSRGPKWDARVFLSGIYHFGK